MDLSGITRADWDKFRTKRGVHQVSDAAHILSFELFKGVLDTRRGQRVTDEERKEQAFRDLALDANLRIKSIPGNRGFGPGQDRGEDAALLAAVRGQAPTEGGTTLLRALHIVRKRDIFSSPDVLWVVDRIAELKWENPDTGRKIAVKNIDANAAGAGEVDRRCALFQRNEIRLNLDGSIARNSKAVLDGRVTFRQDGLVDRRCSAVVNRELLLCD